MSALYDQDDLLAFNSEEKNLVRIAIDGLRGRNIDEALMVERRFADLETLASAISRFPPISQTQLLAGIKRDSHSLASSLIELSGTARLLHTPTRVVAARSFLVAKFHAFSLLTLALGEDDLIESLRNVSLEIIFTIMVEDVYLSCLEDEVFPSELKEDLALDLIRLWDRGRDPRASSHVPSLKTLWAVRKANTPSFGTLEGISELLRISMGMADDWTYFVNTHIREREMRLALEEFIFGLTSEELIALRDYFKGEPTFILDETSIERVLGNKRHFIEASDADPRMMYEFYVQRRDLALLRRSMGNKKRKTAESGPLHTIEDLYLRYRFTQEGKEVTF